MDTKVLLEKSKATRQAVSSFTDFLKSEFGHEVTISSSVISQMYHSAEDFYWELTGIESDLIAVKTGVRYFVDGIQVSEQEAIRIKNDNDVYLEKARATGNAEHLLNCKFVVELK